MRRNNLGVDNLWFHAITEESGKRYWWNRSRNDLVNDLLVPYITKHVQIVKRGEKKVLFNFSTVTNMTIIGIENRLNRPKPGAIPLELKDKDFVK